MTLPIVTVVAVLLVETSTPGAGAKAEVTLTETDLAHSIGKELRCPVCQGMPIAESPSQMAQDMMTRVHQMLAEGKSRQEIFDYFVERYGEWVLLAPKPTGMNLTLWLLPAAALLIGLLLVWRFARKRQGAAPVPEAKPAAADATLEAIRDEVNE
ncbi:MAG: cytochrome c-type biogenesis protein CcmH [Deltaproteobacteria bacterium]|nr:cytochrome c-type biogenesis protein CcmH [Deltaproteobacteria bacterium]